jgi:hypothetical protein
MVTGYLIGNSKANEFLYRLPEGHLSYGPLHQNGELIQMHLKDDVGFLVCEKKILYVVRTELHDEKVSIRELSTRQLLSSNPGFKDKAGYTKFNREKASTWELFETCGTCGPLPWLDFYFRTLKSNSLQDIFDRISSGGSVDIPFLSYILNIISNAHLDQIIRTNLGNEGFLKGILKIANGNYLITPLLAELTRTNALRQPRFIGNDRDIYGRNIDLRNPWFILNSAIRRNIKKTGKACIVATARNEGIYIIEWIAYHLELGFEKIFIYSNNNQDGSLALLRALHDNGHIELIESDVSTGGNAQVKAYTHSLLANSHVNNYEWCAFIDVDEFISFDTTKFVDLADYLAWCGGTGAQVIALSWILAANSLRSENWLNEPITSRMKKRSPFQSNLIKCIVRPETAAFSGPHYPISTNGCALAIVNTERQRYEYERLENPADITRAKTPTFKNAYLYHFELKSFPELIWKYSRNRGNYSTFTDDIHLNEHFMDRIAHFRKCLDNGQTEPINLTIDTPTIISKMEELLAERNTNDARNLVVELTLERYNKLLQFLPIFLEQVPDDERLNRSKKWILEHFLKTD